MYSIPPPDGFSEAVELARQRTNLKIPIEYPAVAQAPWNYEDRLEEVTDIGLKKLTVRVPERHDLALMKIMRADRRDLEGIVQMHAARPFEPETLTRRFIDEMDHVVADHHILRQQLAAAMSTLFGHDVGQKTLDRVARAPLDRELRAATLVRNASILHAAGLRPETLDHARFAGRILQTFRGAIVYPFEDRSGVVGVRFQPERVSGAPEKGVWTSCAFPDDSALVIVDTSADALSYY